MPSGLASKDSFNQGYTQGFIEGAAGASHTLDRSSQPPPYEEAPAQQHQVQSKPSKKHHSHSKPAKEHPSQPELAKQHMDTPNDQTYIAEHPITYGTTGKKPHPHIVHCHQSCDEAIALEFINDHENMVYCLCGGCVAGACCCYLCTVM